MAWRFVSHLTQREAIEYLCYELPAANAGAQSFARPLFEEANIETGTRPVTEDTQGLTDNLEDDERLPLLDDAELTGNSFDDELQDNTTSIPDENESFASAFAGLNALEVAAVAGAKKFLSEKPIQRIVNGIWKGDIVFWDTLSTHSMKKARTYNRDRSDPFCRLRVPLYLKVFEIVFFVAFLAFYYTVLVEESPARSVTAAEVMLYVWLAAFTYNGLSNLRLL